MDDEEKEHLNMQDCVHLASQAAQSNIMEADYYIFHNHKFTYEFAKLSTKFRRLCLGPQYTFCIPGRSEFEESASSAGRILRSIPIPTRNRVRHDAFEGFKFEVLPDNFESNFTISTTITGGNSCNTEDDDSVPERYTSRDTFSTPDFAGFYWRGATEEEVIKSVMMPWILFEIKSSRVKLNVDYLTEDTFGHSAKVYARHVIKNTIDQVNRQLRHAFVQYPNIKTLVVFIASGPIFQFFVATIEDKRGKPRTESDIYLRPLHREPECLFTTDEKGQPKAFTRQFRTYWRLACIEGKMNI